MRDKLITIALLAGAIIVPAGVIFALVYLS
jgi:hypothetical protein